MLIGVNDNGLLSGLKANDKLLQSLGGLRSDGNILPEMADKIGISVKGIEKIIASLKNEGHIERVGSRKTGHWVVIK